MEADASGVPFSRSIILCVDDDPDALTILSLFLTGEGFLVITAGSATEALVRMQQRLPDFIITDYTMPGMSGLELCRRLRDCEETRGIPIILYTAMGLPAASRLYDRTFLKPTDLDVFAGEIRRLLTAANS